MIRHIMLFYLIGLIFFGLTVRTIESPNLILLSFFVICGFGVFLTAFLGENAVRGNLLPVSLKRIGILSFWVWLVALLLITYGLFVSIIGGWNLKTSLALSFRFVPLALFPIFAYSIRTEKGWLVLLFIMIAEGLISALVDISVLSNNRDEIVRLMSGEIISIDYFYALLIAVLLLLLYPLKRYMQLFLIVCIVPLLWRTFLSISRGEAVIFFLVLLYCFAVVLVWLKKNISKILVMVVIVSVTLFVFYRISGVDDMLWKYLEFYQARLEVIGDSLRYRWEELVGSVQNAGLLGKGWGAEGDFSSSTQLTSSSHALSIKTYTHNLAGFIVWKLGILLGGSLLSFFAIYLLNEFRFSVHLKDALGFVFFGLFLAWGLHAMVNMYFLRVELNIWVAAWLGYFCRRRLWMKSKTKMNSIHIKPLIMIRPRNQR